MAGPSRPPDPQQLSELLCQKERDLELAAKIGQSLLEQNKELQTRNEFLEETLVSSSDEVVQLKHELSKRIDLLKVYSHYEDDESIGTGEDDSSLRKRIDRLSTENNQLKKERSSLRRLADTATDSERRHVKELSRQLDAANDKIESLHVAIAQKSEECSAQTEAVERLLEEIGERHGRERQLVADNEEMQHQLEEAIQRQNTLLAESLALQEDYTELRGMFCEAEEELARYRAAPSNRTQSVDSLYDSLASELENSDSGFSSSGPMRKNRALHLELTECQTASTSGEVDVPTALLTELAQKKISIAPVAPPQTPVTQSTPSTPEGAICGTAPNSTTPNGAAPALDPEASEEMSPAKTAILVRSTTCDASTSMADLSAPMQEMQKLKVETTPTLELSTPLSAQRAPSRSIIASAPSLSAMLSRPKTISKTPSQDSLEDYVAPKMGEPGIPGTRDLDFSLKQLKARRKDASPAVPQTATQPLHTPPSACLFRRVVRRNFFDAQKSAALQSSTPNWTDYSVSYGQERHRAVVSPTSIGLGGAMKSVSGHGVVTRAELSPSSTPLRVCPQPTGLASLIPSSLFSTEISSPGGILRRAL